MRTEGTEYSSYVCKLKRLQLHRESQTMLTTLAHYASVIYSRVAGKTHSQSVQYIPIEEQTEQSVNGKGILRGWEDRDTPSVGVGNLSPCDQNLDRRFNLFLNLQQASHYALINKNSKHSTDSQSTPKNTTLINYESSPYN